MDSKDFHKHNKTQNGMNITELSTRQGISVDFDHS